MKSVIRAFRVIRKLDYSSLSLSALTFICGLCDLEQVHSLLWASISQSIKGNTIRQFARLSENKRRAAGAHASQFLHSSRF